MTNPRKLPSTEIVPDYAKGDFYRLKQCISINCSSEFSDVGAQIAWTVFKTKLQRSTDDFIPTKIRRSGDRPLWMNNNIMRLIRKKRRLRTLYKTTRDYAEYQAYIEVQKTVVRVVTAAKKKFERKLAKNIKKNPRQFYSHLNSHTKSRSQIGLLQTDQGHQVSDSQGMCDILNSFFSSVFTDEGTTNNPVPRQMCEATISPNFTLTEEMFRKKLANVKNGATGPDKITKRLLSELKDVVAQPIYNIFKKSLSTGEVPEDWRIANVTPVFKNGVVTQHKITGL